MDDSRRPSGPSEIPSWAMRMNEAIERVAVLVLMSLTWLVLTVAGLVLLGIGPATIAAAEVVLALREGERARVLPRMWRSFREELVRANLRMLPLLLVQGGALMLLWIATAGLAGGPGATLALGVVAAIAGAWTTIALAAIAVSPRVRRQDPLVCWRLVLLLPGALPLRAVALVLLVLLWSLACSLLWPLALLLGPAVAVELAVALLSRRITELLAQIDASTAAA
ncbi:YesL family protein [Brachybacterium sp. NBEC-018]|uniref:YesL family protein n=1 Tax=Brachybacterium sp. NBEC-018 TaxID=2996004 RepID=UPI002174D507|nr:YesL family protein [Brachybacterium sp. NBEC-018]UVY83247.1 YesL family protein [Brachybacterium sp. NBEC-018]